MSPSSVSAPKSMLKPPCHVLVAIAFLLQTVLSQTCSDSSRMVAVVSVADLVQRWAHELDSITLVGDVLDLACGKGQNGLFVARRDQEKGRADRKVVLLDRSIGDAVAATADCSDELVMHHVQHLEVDLETEENPSPLPIEAYGAVLVFRYLHRPLVPNLRDSVKPGGLVLYETFTWEQPLIGGRPSNPMFLLRPGELKELFPGWEVLHFFEGVEDGAREGEGGTEVPFRRAVSSIVCRKPV